MDVYVCVCMWCVIGCRHLYSCINVCLCVCMYLCMYACIYQYHMLSVSINVCMCVVKLTLQASSAEHITVALLDTSAHYIHI